MCILYIDISNKCAIIYFVIGTDVYIDGCLSIGAANSFPVVSNKCSFFVERHTEQIRRWVTANGCAERRDGETKEELKTEKEYNLDYRDNAKDLLEHKTEYLSARDTLTNEIDMLNNEKYTAKSAVICDTSVTKGGASKYEEHLVNIIMMIDDATFRKHIVERKLKQIDSGFSLLDDYERDLLNTYYVYKVKTPTEIIMKKFHKERTQVNVDRNHALEKFTRGVYGIVQF